MSTTLPSVKIYPAIDLNKGRCVRLQQGEAALETVFFEDPGEPAGLWKDAGAEWVHVVDLQGALRALLEIRWLSVGFWMQECKCR